MPSPARQLQLSDFAITPTPAIAMLETSRFPKIVSSQRV
jgi:hypothetical protein